MTPNDIKAALLRKDFNTSSAAVFIDFFTRRGLITADAEADYTEMNMRPHRTLLFLMARCL